ncbi:hypothetical protein D1007_57563 [Hordeum vulgare]|nr:hypothetical protein D1007_57563 [Hordeum vulgare]
MFASATTVTLGDGRTTLFWFDAWLDGMAPRDLAPGLVAVSARKGRKVVEALAGTTWLLDLSPSFEEEMLDELIALSSRLQWVTLREGTRDGIVWKLRDNGIYSAKSTYKLMFSAHVGTPMLSLVWRVKATLKSKVFMWTALQNRVLTTDVLLRRGWENDYFCPLCRRNQETITHMLSECTWSKQLWEVVASSTRCQSLRLATWRANDDLMSWLDGLSCRLPKQQRYSVKSLGMLVCWEIWKERNRRIFDKKVRSIQATMVLIRDEASIWWLAGCHVPFDPG